jgi:hypothetical protein
MHENAHVLNAQDSMTAGAGNQARTWCKRLGFLTFMFFLVKGLAWLIVPAVLVWWRATA